VGGSGAVVLCDLAGCVGAVRVDQERAVTFTDCWQWLGSIKQTRGLIYVTFWDGRRNRPAYDFLRAERDRLAQEVELHRNCAHSWEEQDAKNSQEIMKLKEKAERAEKQARELAKALNRLHDHAHQPCLSDICFAKKALSAYEAKEGK
jgi:hypothetical protein